MHCSKIVQLWNETQIPKKLKFIDLSHSEDLIQTPDFSMLPNLEQLVLEGCIKLVRVHPSLGHHKKIALVNLKDCKNLRALPYRLEMDSLEELILSGCLKLKKLPEYGENMKYLSILKLKDCNNLVCFPSSIGNLKSLKTLNIFGCSKFCSLPEKLYKIESIEELNVSKTAIREIPSSIVGLKRLRKLYANGCSGFAPDSSQSLLSPVLRALGFNSYEAPIKLTLPPSISGLSSLKELNLSYCNLNAGSIPNDLSCLPSLEVLDLSGNDFGNLPSGSYVLPPSFSSLSSLRELYLEDCNLSDGSIPDDLSSLSSLERLILSRNKFINLPPALVSNLLALRVLHLSHCNRLLSLPYLPPNIDDTFANNCKPSMKILFPDWLSSGDGIFKYASGREIPPWFHNQNFDFVDNEKTCISIKVDISRFSGSSEQWGIFVCFVMKDMAPTRSRNPKQFEIFHMNTSRTKSNPYRGHRTRLFLEGNNPHLVVKINCHDYWGNAFLGNTSNQVEFRFETSWILFDGSREKVALRRKCGWRLIGMQHQMPREELGEYVIAIDAETG